MQVCQSATHNDPRYSDMHGGEVEYSIHLYCPECNFCTERTVCSTYADIMAQAVMRSPNRLVSCGNCGEPVTLEDYVEDIVEIQPGKSEAEKILSPLFQEPMPCESPSHTNPSTEHMHTIGGMGEYYVYGCCDSCGFKTIKLYCVKYTYGILTETALAPYEEIVCPSCATSSTMGQWIKSVTNRTTGNTRNF